MKQGYCIYYWTEDGLGETGFVEALITKEETKCYHCGKIIAEGDEGYLFNSDDGENYIICSRCGRNVFKRVHK